MGSMQGMRGGGALVCARAARQQASGGRGPVPGDGGADERRPTHAARRGCSFAYVNSTHARPSPDSCTSGHGHQVSPGTSLSPSTHRGPVDWYAWLPPGPPPPPRPRPPLRPQPPSPPAPAQDGCAGRPLQLHEDDEPEPAAALLQGCCFGAAATAAGAATAAVGRAPQLLLRWPAAGAGRPARGQRSGCMGAQRRRSYRASRGVRRDRAVGVDRAKLPAPDCVDAACPALSQRAAAISNMHEAAPVCPCLARRRVQGLCARTLHTRRAAVAAQAGLRKGPVCLATGALRPGGGRSQNWCNWAALGSTQERGLPSPLALSPPSRSSPLPRKTPTPHYLSLPPLRAPCFRPPPTPPCHRASLSQAASSSARSDLGEGGCPLPPRLLALRRAAARRQRGCRPRRRPIGALRCGRSSGCAAGSAALCCSASWGRRRRECWRPPQARRQGWSLTARWPPPPHTLLCAAHQGA